MTRFLWSEYAIRFFWWEPIELLRKLCLTGFVLLIDNKHTVGRTLAAVLLSLIFLVGQLTLKPFKRAIDNVISALIHFSLTLLFLSVLLLKVCEDSRQTCSALGLGDDGEGVLLFFLAFSTSIVGVFLLLLILQLVRERKSGQGTLYLRTTASVPELSRSDGMAYHLFLSHIWASGQDQVAVIKRQLQLCLPGSHIFLDVDDLKDIDSLERYIDESALILIFLSRGYFKSRNCLREARSSMEKQKPLVLVHEADGNKGGLSMEDVRQDCPADLADFVLSDRAPIRWHRVKEYQSVCLKQIALATLQACPGMRKAQHVLAGGLYFKGELSAESLHFRHSVVLLVSEDNPGAAALGEELTRTFNNIVVRSASASVTERGLPLALTSAKEKEKVFLLLYLNHKTFVGEPGVRLASQIRAVLEHKRSSILLLHENEEAHGGCEFGRFFEVTPEDLIAANLYGQIAIAFHGARDLDSPSLTSPFRQVSYALTAQKMGAIRRKNAHRMRSFRTMPRFVTKPEMISNRTQTQRPLSAVDVATKDVDIETKV